MVELRGGLAFLLGVVVSCAPGTSPALDAGGDSLDLASQRKAGAAPPSPVRAQASEQVAEPRPAGAAPDQLARPSAAEKREFVWKHPELSAFYSALTSLHRGARQEPVRVLWLGDSHTAADFMTHPVREALGELAPLGGPGFIRLGLPGYRHGSARVTITGDWGKAPLKPSQTTRVGDGVYGYGGIRTRPEAGAEASLELREKRDDPFRWILSYRLRPGAELEVRFGQQVARLRPVQSGEGPHPPGILQAVFTGTGAQKLKLRHVAGDPEVFGIFGEYLRPGIVLDTVGIDGARVATALAWEPEQYASTVKARGLSLFVLAFGTNEVFDQTEVVRYEGHVDSLLGRWRDAAPGVPCWVIGPPDSSDTRGASKSRVGSVTEAFRRAAHSRGCAFTSAFELMGGEGSFSQWRNSHPPRARADRVHLTVDGYEHLGQLLAVDLAAPLAPDSALSP